MKLKEIYFKIYDFTGNHFASEANELLKESQYWSRDEIENYQVKRLYKLITHAKKNIPYYQNTIKSFPEENWNYQEMMQYMQDIPILTKENIQNSFEELIDPKANRKKLIYQITGGTTGRPTRFYHDRLKLDYTRVAVQRNFDWAGYSLRKKCLRLASGNLEAQSHNNLKGKIKNIFYNRHFYEAAILDDQTWVADVLKIIQNKKIKVLWGYPSIIYMLARKLKNGTNLGIETIVTSSETLQVTQKNVIEDAFGCSIYDEYGLREFAIAGECENHQGMHINEELLLLEILDENNHHCNYGQNGRLLVTDLLNMSFPFIRYEIGDEGTFLTNKACSCGRTLKRLKNVSGRSSDNIQINGKLITTVFFPGFFKSIYEIEAFQVFVYFNALEINVIPKDRQNKKIIANIEKKLRSVFDNQIPLTVKSVDCFVREANGKVLSIKRMHSRKE